MPIIYNIIDCNIRIKLLKDHKNISNISFSYNTKNNLNIIINSQRTEKRFKNKENFKLRNTTRTTAKYKEYKIQPRRKQ